MCMDIHEYSNTPQIFDLQLPTHSRGAFVITGTVEIHNLCKRHAIATDETKDPSTLSKHAKLDLCRFIHLPPFDILLIVELMFPKPIFVLAATVTKYFVDG